MQTDKLENKQTNKQININKHKSVTKCCCTTLIDKSELLVLHLRKMSCGTTLSLRHALCGCMISQSWLETLSTAALEAGTLKTRITGRWSLSSEVWLLLPECQAVGFDIIHVQISFNLLQSAARCLTWRRLVGVVGKELWTFDWRRSLITCQQMSTRT